MQIAHFVFTLALLAVPLATEAQPAGKAWRIGFLATGAPAVLPAFRDGLRALGYEEGKNITIEYRSAEGRADRLRHLAAELVRLKVDLIVVFGTQATEAARDASRTIPIVMAVSGDAVGTGLVASLARPGSNVTGITFSTPELAGKRLELLREAVPNLANLSVLWNPADPPRQRDMAAMQTAAQGLGIKVHSVEVRRVEDIDAAFAALSRPLPDALVVFPDPVLGMHRKRIVDFAARQRRPAMYGNRAYVQEGGLMSYAPSFDDAFRRSASYVDKILKGAKPADLPVEQPSKFEFVINLKTAQALGLTIPRTLLLRVDHVIE